MPSTVSLAPGEQAAGAPSIDAPSAAAACPACGAAAPERFCARCGEEQVHARDLSLRHFVREGIAAVTDFDSALLRSLVTVVRRPGLLTREYVAGSRRRYLPPLKLFFVCNVLFFFVESITHSSVLTTPLYVYLHYEPFKPVVTGLVRARLLARHVSDVDYAKAFDPMSHTQAKTLVITMAPMLAVLVALLFAQSRRFFVEHLVFSVHFYSFFLLLVAGLGGLLSCAYLGMRLLGLPRLLLSDDALGATLLSACGLYLAVAIRRVYGERPAVALLKAAALAFGIFWVLQGYRFLLFYTTFLAT